MYRHLFNHLLIISFLFFLPSAEVFAQGFGMDVNYEQASPAFIDAIHQETQSVKDSSELDEILSWNDAHKERLPEFLDDLLTIAQQLESQGTPEFVFERYQAFADKWNVVAQEYPGLEELDAVLSPVIDQLLAGLPKLEKSSGDVPMQSLFEYYKEMEIQNPWGLGVFFQLQPLPSELKVTKTTELSRELTIAGIKRIFITRRETLVTVNGVIAFFEAVNDDKVVQKFVRYRDPSLIHEILIEMKKDNGDPLVISVLEELTAMIDAHLEMALEKGVLDRCSYNHIYRKRIEPNNPECANIHGDKTEFMKIVKYDPFDFLNQVELEFNPTGDITKDIDYLQGLALQLPDVPVSNINAVMTNYQSGVEGTAKVWFLGILVPAYVLSILSLVKPF